MTEREGSKVVPYEAIVYDAIGRDLRVHDDRGPHLHAQPGHRLRASTVRTRCSADGPDAGTEVVTIGTAELFGVEKEIGY